MSVRGRGKGEERRARACCETILPANTNVPLEQQHPTEARREAHGDELRGATSATARRSVVPSGATIRNLPSDFKFRPFFSKLLVRSFAGRRVRNGLNAAPWKTSSRRIADNCRAFENNQETTFRARCCLYDYRLPGEKIAMKYRTRICSRSR